MVKILAILAIILSSLPVLAQDQSENAWYHRDYAKPRPTTLKAALASTRRFLGYGNVGWKMQGDANVCAALKEVGVACDYNTRGDLTMFLAVNGKALFPWQGKTNPWVTDDTLIKLGFPDDVFVGRPAQNKEIAAAVRRNAKLFKNGDLTADDVKTKWR